MNDGTVVRRQENHVMTTTIITWHLIFVHVASLSIYLILWVANAVLLQGVASGSLAPQNNPYDKPAFLTWFDYNFLILGLLFPLIAHHHRRHHHTHHHYHDRCGWWHESFVEQYLKNEWAGRLGFHRAMASCAGIAFLLTALNIAFIVALECISVALSNAIYQLQTAFTVCLSVMMLGDQFVQSELVGLVASFCGVLLIIIPPLTAESRSGDAVDDIEDVRWSSCSSTSSTIIGVVAMLVSAILWGFFQVAWRLLSESKDLASSRNAPSSSSLSPPSSLERLGVLADTMATLGMIGLCNLILVWPLLFVFHWTDFEVFELPPKTHWWLLIFNALVEVAFDASCAIAIYMTSPIMTSITAPLTIPLSLVADKILYGASSEAFEGLSGWIGAIIILAGVILMETKPDFGLKILTFKARCLPRENSALLETELRDGNQSYQQQLV